MSDARGAGSRPRGRPRSDQPALGQADVVRAALRVIDTEGDRALSMRRVAAELGVYPTAVQHHVNTKEQLLVAVSDAVLDEMVMPSPDVDWVEWLEVFSAQLRAVLHAHPNVVPVMAARLRVATGAFTLSEQLLAALAGAGFTGAALRGAYNSVIGFVFGWIFTELAAEPAADEDAWRQDLRSRLERVDPAEAPTLAVHVDDLRNRAFMMRWMSGQSNPLDDSFEFAVRVMVSGLQAQLDRQ
ncbi:TetR/AcrR family transcriptional regulator [Nocardioides sp. GY 10127]|uniref:TetR/AcrR family transcriptional regulator n=1 Tax=Nocardioides sp. GY 10127 TaxID=2569762 RepID=UPI001457E5D7|nr:TetR/AcrR family transcriptional regulator [Nocardioides sp. GY 10127]